MSYEKINNKEYALVDYLIKNNLHISFAESCTGGLLSAKLVNVPDASVVFDSSVVTYANEAKMKFLGVKKETIEAYGVVSEAVAKEMAAGAALSSCGKTNRPAEIGVSTSGVAGPGGGTAEKPVGMVCFGFYINGRTYADTVFFDDSERNTIRQEAACYAFNRLYELLTASH